MSVNCLAKAPEELHDKLGPLSVCAVSDHLLEQIALSDNIPDNKQIELTRQLNHYDWADRRSHITVDTTFSNFICTRPREYAHYIRAVTECLDFGITLERFY